VKDAFHPYLGAMDDSVCIIHFGSRPNLLFPGPYSSYYFMKSRSFFVILILFIAAVFLSACQGIDGAFGPISPTPTQIGVVNRPPVPVNFETLHSDPFIFVDRFVQVTGRYAPPRQLICSRQRGPSIDWFLISDGLEMNMSGFGSVVTIAPEQAFFTLDGIWRQYDGPVGCAKEPKQETVWYLEVVRIVDPNPLVASTNSLNGVAVIPSENSAIDSQSEVINDAQNGSQPIEILTTAPTITLSPTVTPITGIEGSDATETADPATSTPATATPTVLSSAVGGTDGTATPTPTEVSPEEQSLTATITPTASSTGDNSGGLNGTGSGTPNPATPVPIPNGYPSSAPNTPVVSPAPTAYP
jgi:hypothetical protein